MVGYLTTAKQKSNFCSFSPFNNAQSHTASDDPESPSDIDTSSTELHIGLAKVGGGKVGEGGNTNQYIMALE